MSGLRLTTRLRASTERVWHALTEPDGLVSWRAPWAEVDGARIACAWAGEPESTYDVVARDDGRVLDLYDAERSLRVRFSLAGTPDGTVLATDLGGPAPAALDDIADTWEALLVGLAHALDAHPDEACAWAIAAIPTPLDPWQAWGRALESLHAIERVDDLAPGDAITMRPASGEAWPGLLLRCDPPRHLAATVQPLGDALLHVHVVDTANGSELAVEMLLYGQTEAAVDRAQARLERWLHGLVRPGWPKGRVP